MGLPVFGVICEVKAGKYKEAKVFKDEYVEYSIKRLGFCLEIGATRFAELKATGSVDLNGSHQIIKLLMSNIPPKSQEAFRHISITNAQNFIKQRFINYREKQSD